MKVDLDAVRRRHADYEKAWADPPEERPSPTWMTMTACSCAGDVPALVAALERSQGLADEIAGERDEALDGWTRTRKQLDALAPLVERLRQVRRDWPNLVDMDPVQAWRDIQEIMALQPPGEL